MTLDLPDAELTVRCGRGAALRCTRSAGRRSSGQSSRRPHDSRAAGLPRHAGRKRTSKPSMRSQRAALRPGADGLSDAGDGRLHRDRAFCASAKRSSDRRALPSSHSPPTRCRATASAVSPPAWTTTSASRSVARRCPRCSRAGCPAACVASVAERATRHRASHGPTAARTARRLPRALDAIRSLGGETTPDLLEQIMRLYSGVRAASS